MTNGSLFRAYIGAQSTGVKFSDVPINTYLRNFDFILSFGVDVEKRNPRTTTNGVFSPFWDTNKLTPEAVRAIKSTHTNVRVMVGIGGNTVLGDHNKIFFTPTAAVADSWVENAFTSLRDIIDHYGLDGVDVDYENFAAGTDVHTFSSCIGRLFARLKTHYLPKEMFTSIAPFCDPQVQKYYRQLWTDHSSVIDVVNFQFYRCGLIPDVATYLSKYNEQITNYPGAKVLASFLIGSGPMNVKPDVALEAAKQLIYRNSLPGLFTWSADNSNGFSTIVRAQQIIVEVEKLKGLKFKSYADRQKYLKDTKDACDKVSHIIESTKDMITQTEAEKDVTKQDIAKDVYEYCTKGIGISLQFIRSYHTRLTYLDKLKSHSDYLIEQLKWLNPATQQKEAQRLALEAGMYNKATLDIAKKFQHFIPNQFSKWLKENGIKFEDLVQSNMAKLGFTGPFKNLDDIQKLQVYESIIEEAGQGKSVVTHTSEALGKLGVAFLVFTAAAMVWDIYTAEDKLQAAVTDAVNALTAVVDLEIGEVVNAAVEAGFVAADIEIASAAVTVIGAVAGFGIGVIIGMATGAMLDLIFSSGTSKVKITDGLTGCCVSPMPEGLPLARLVKHNFPDL